MQIETQLKRYAIFALVLTLCAGGAFAQLYVGGGMNMTVVPLQFVAHDTAEGEGNPWLGSGTEISTGITLMGNHENRFGFRADLVYFFSHTGAMEARLDDGHLWMDFADWFGLDVGRFVNGSQAGNVGGHWLSAWTVGMFGGGHIFTPHIGNIGALARIAPPQVEGLAVYVLVPHFGMPLTRADQEFAWLPCGLLAPGGDSIHYDDESSSRYRAFRVFQRTWLTVGYQFADSFHVRAQFVGANPFGNINWTAGADQLDVDPYRWRMGFNAPRVEAAFAYVTRTLTVDFGARAWIPVSEWITDTWNVDPNNPGYLRGGHPGTFWGGIGFGVGATFLATDDLRISLRADGDFLRTWTGPYRGVERIVNPTRLSFHLWPSYTLDNDITLTLAIGVNYVGRNTVEMADGSNPNDGNVYWERSNRLRMGGGLSAAIPLFANSSVNIGLTYRHGTADIRGGEPRVITVPVSFSFNW